MMNEKNFKLVKKLRHELHEHPELSNQEVWTKNHLIKFIKEHTKLDLTEAEKYKLKVSFSYQNYFPETKNLKESNNKIRKVCHEEGIQIIDLKEAYRFSEDFGHYTKLTKGAICYIGNGYGYPHIHTQDFDYRDKLIKTTVELFEGLIALGDNKCL